MRELKILVVEDSPITRQLVSLALRGILNAQIIEAYNGVDGLKKIAEDGFDLLIVDINMPIMDGLSMVQEVRKIGAYKDTPIIIISIESGVEAQERAKSLGVNAYVCKPSRTSDITAVIKKLLDVEVKR